MSVQGEQPPQREPLVADLFHALNQPLSSLHCALELMISAPLPGETSRAMLTQSLAQVHQIAEYVVDIRELWEVSTPCESRIQLDELLREAVEDLGFASQPVRTEFLIETESCRVINERTRLKLVLTRLLEYAIDSSFAGQRVRIELNNNFPRAQLTIRLLRATNETSGPELVKDARERQTLERRQNLRLALAHELLGSRGGVLSIRDSEREISLGVSLALA